LLGSLALQRGGSSTNHGTAAPASETALEAALLTATHHPTTLISDPLATTWVGHDFWLSTTVRAMFHVGQAGGTGATSHAAIHRAASVRPSSRPARPVARPAASSTSAARNHRPLAPKPAATAARPPVPARPAPATHSTTHVTSPAPASHVPVPAVPARITSVAGPHRTALGTFVATCYDLSGITASGAPVGPSTIAVDPSVIPLGSHLYILGVGYRIAQDTGGAIKGRRLDIWAPTYGQCASWGVESVQVWLVS
jgi:3D (Asp-Asp-Asp) domain-containing protein